MTGVYLPVMGTGSWQTLSGPPKELPAFPGGPALNLRPARESKTKQEIALLKIENNEITQTKPISSCS